MGCVGDVGMGSVERVDRRWVFCGLWCKEERGERDGSWPGGTRSFTTEFLAGGGKVGVVMR